MARRAFSTSLRSSSSSSLLPSSILSSRTSAASRASSLRTASSASSTLIGCPVPLPFAWLSSRSLATSKDVTSTPAKRKRTTVSELVDYLSQEEKNEALQAHKEETGAVERKTHLDNWLKRYGYTLQEIDPVGTEVVLTKTDPQFKVTLKLDMESRRLVETEKDQEGDEEGEEGAEAANEGEEEEGAQNQAGEVGDGEDSAETGGADDYFEEKDLEIWVENKKGEVLAINGDLTQRGLELWNVTVYPDATKAADKNYKAVRFDPRKIDQAGYDHWKVFLRGFGIEDEFVLISEVLCEQYDEKAYNLWLKKSKEFLLA